MTHVLTQYSVSQGSPHAKLLDIRASGLDAMARADRAIGRTPIYEARQERCYGNSAKALGAEITLLYQVQTKSS